MKNEKEDIFYPVIGYQHIKSTLLRVLDVINNKEKYQKLNVKLPHGILLYGAPGIGKTSLSEAFIKNSKRTKFVIRKDKGNNEFIDSMSKIFEDARSQQPSIILIDDIDKFSDTKNSDFNAEEYVAVQALMEKIKNDDVFVIATANDKKRLPVSLLRAGRFDYVMEMTTPKGEDSKKVIEFYLSNKKVSKDIDTDKISKMLNGRSCAELEKVVNEAGIYAGMDNREEIKMDDIIKAALSIIYEKTLEEQTKSPYLLETAYHEAGHAIVAEYLEPNSIAFISVSNYDTDIEGITIYNQNDYYFNDMWFMENRVKSLLAGKAATEIIYGKHDVGADSDISRATEITSRFISSYCINDFENVHMDNTDSNEIKYKFEIVRNALLNKYYQEVKRILVDNRKLLDKVAKTLATKKVLFSSDIEKLKEDL